MTKRALILAFVALTFSFGIVVVWSIDRLEATLHALEPLRLPQARVPLTEYLRDYAPDLKAEEVLACIDQRQDGLVWDVSIRTGYQERQRAIELYVAAWMTARYCLKLAAGLPEKDARSVFSELPGGLNVSSLTRENLKRRSVYQRLFQPVVSRPGP